MEKSRIKEMLREDFNKRLQEAGESRSVNKNYDKDYSEVQQKLKDTMLKQNQVMHAAGLGDPNNATDRSLFSKKVNKETNEEGGQYLFDDSELANVIKVLSNPGNYLGVKNK